MIELVTALKLKILDNPELRTKIDTLYQQTDHKVVAKWSLLIAKRILEQNLIQTKDLMELERALDTLELWLLDQASVYEIRQASLKTHKLAKKSSDTIKQSALRVIGHAIASGHMKEHAMVASDYAIKTINLSSNNNFKKITKERQWQMKTLKSLKNNTCSP